MSRKIKFHTFHFLFRLVAYLADKSGGWRVFVRPKLLLGSLIVGLGLLSTGFAQTSKQNKSKQKTHRTIQKNENSVTVKEDSIIYSTNNPVVDVKGNCRETMEHTSQNNTYTIAEQMPQFPGGEKALMKYISENIKYPITAQENGIQGKVICRFIITAKGEIDRVEILRSLDPACDKESVRLIKTLPKFSPAKRNGVSVSVWYTLPINFNPGKAQNEIMYTPPKTSYICSIQDDDIIDPHEFIDKDSIYESIDDWPKFPGGEFALFTYINENIKYPKTNIRGKVIVRFEVTKTGEIGRSEILQSLDPVLDDEALRVVKSLPKWIPGKHKGKYVNVWYILPINFGYIQQISISNNGDLTPVVYESIKQMPQFPGGEKELANYISKELVYPMSAKQKGIQGNVYVRFVVTKTGALDRVEVVRSLTPDCDTEAIRLVKSLPAWTPGKLDGKNVDVYYTIALPFKFEK
jgi:TonB family protein